MLRRYHATTAQSNAQVAQLRFEMIQILHDCGRQGKRKLIALQFADKYLSTHSHT